MHRAGGGDDEIALEIADVGNAAVDAPDVGLNQVLDELDQLVGALGFGEGAILGVFVAILEKAASASATSTAAASGAVALGLRGFQAEFRSVGEIGDDHQQVIDEIQA